MLTLILVVLLTNCSKSNISEASYLTEKITFPSKNILGFEHLFNEGLVDQEDLEVFGVLHFPDNYDAATPYPTIVASHGSSNWREHHLKYIEQMRQADFIVFAMHPFDSRGVNSTVGNQINVTSETMIYEMAMSLNLCGMIQGLITPKYMLQVGVWEAPQRFLMHGCRYKKH